MGPEITGSERARAWVLIRAEPVVGMAAKFRNLDRRGDDFVIIRADVVAESPDSPYNIVVPVDAESEAALSGVVEEMRGISGVREAVALRVVGHDPYPPHDASGYITQREADRGERRPDKVGRQDSSPGYNPWG